MEDIHRILEALQQCRQRSVLATITRVEGSAYRKEGASMLLFKDGTQVGVLSTGCLEADIAARVPELLAAGVPHTYTFDLEAADPLSWGEGPGCGGVIQVTAVVVGDSLRRHLLMLKDYLDDQIEVMLILKNSADPRASGYSLVTSSGHRFGEWPGTFPEALRDWATAQMGRRSGMQIVPGDAEEVFLHTFFPKPRLTLFGAGPDAKPLASFAAAAGFTVTVADWRAALCDRSFFPDAHTLLDGFPEETAGQIRWTPNDYVVIMTHHFRRDRDLIRILSGHNLAYVGLLGSKRRTQRLLEGGSLPEHWHAPVGLPIGADGPEEIAISIVAELIQVYRTFRKRRLSNETT
ncbi:xanthine dehydrogenase accessory factor [Paenibacillus rhizosphaerae]|uniref:Xanthine dehydrogenase accessory factor n=1 Tax=Paenibacillus rhizosphaerae TaxID=297318 RepID=A0A839TLF7_9BACL|nr:XdhC/CoxI family protein [Paenibacillus rhizosphaerae]MBB3125657.1 xanthine dehydrogenase accessory factor [Paenibacillus rhizosphaerae]